MNMLVTKIEVKLGRRGQVRYLCTLECGHTKTKYLGWLGALKGPVAKLPCDKCKR